MPTTTSITTQQQHTPGNRSVNTLRITDSELDVIRKLLAEALTDQKRDQNQLMVMRLFYNQLNHEFPVIQQNDDYHHFSYER